jgi:catechol 2,3-dioxygenase-like lactoylglutathione lyase family enzyme
VFSTFIVTIAKESFAINRVISSPFGTVDGKEDQNMLGSANIIAFVPTKDADKARDFYEGVLGLRFVNDDGFALVLNANGIMIRVAKMKDFSPAQFTILGWQISEIENVVRSLREKGVHFEIFGFFKQDELGIWTAPTGDKVAWFKDPDGNLLSVSQHV